MKNQVQESRPKRPFLVTVLILLVLSYTALGWFGFSETIRQWDFLHEFPLVVPPLYLALRNVFWGLVGIPVIWGLWVGRRWARFATQIAAISYAIYYWLDRVLLADPVAIAGRWSFTLGLTILCLVYMFLVLRLPRSRKFFGYKRKAGQNGKMM